jgi:outer membrane protein assembly factor BamC
MPLFFNKKTILSILILMSVLTIGCSSTGTEFYKHQPSLQPLEVPPDLTLLDVNSGFEIPQIAEAETKKVTLSSGGDVELKKDGRLRWLTIKAEPKDIWDETKEFWIAYKVDLNWESLKLGIMETKWISSYESDYAEDRFRVRIEPGDNPGESDLYISHRGRQEDLIDGEVLEVWAKDYNDPDLEIEVMGELLSYFGLSNDRKTAILDDAKEKPDLVSLNLKADIPNLTMNEPFNRSWRFVAQSVDRKGDIVTQRDKKAGWMDVRLTEGSETTDFVPGFTISDQDRETIRLQLKTKEKETTVIILTDEGQPDSSELAQSYLQNIYDNL